MVHRIGAEELGLDGEGEDLLDLVARDMVRGGAASTEQLDRIRNAGRPVAVQPGMPPSRASVQVTPEGSRRVVTTPVAAELDKPKRGPGRPRKNPLPEPPPDLPDKVRFDDRIARQTERKEERISQREREHELAMGQSADIDTETGEVGLLGIDADAEGDPYVHYDLTTMDRQDQYAIAKVEERRTAIFAATDVDPEVTKRRRAKMGAAAATGRTPTAREIPLSQIREACEIWTTIPTKIYRRNARGAIALIGTFDRTPFELADVDTWLKQEWGGGYFRVEARNPENMAEFAHPIPPFEIMIDGPMKAPNNTAGQTLPAGGHVAPDPAVMAPWLSITGKPMNGATQRVDPRYLPPFLQGEPAHVQLDWAKQVGVPIVTDPHPSAGFGGQPWAFTPDAMAKGELDSVKKERDEARRQADLERKAFDQKFDALQKRLESAEAQRRDDVARAERATQDQRFEMLQRELAQLRAAPAPVAPKPSIDPAMIAALAPILTTFITSQRDASSRAIEMQSKGVSDLMTATLARSDQKPMMDMIKMILPLAMPLLKDWWESNSPKAQSDLVATLAENQLTSVGMMAKMVNEFAANAGGGDQPPWWLPMVQETMRGVTNAAEKLTQSSKAAVPGPAQHVPIQGHVQAPQAQQAQPESGGMNMANALSGMNGQQIAQLIFNDPRLPAEFKSREWFQIITELHNKAPAAELGRKLAGHLRDLDEQQKPLPEALRSIWDTDNPEQLFETVFSALPIWQMDREYCIELARKAIAVLTEPEPKTGGAPAAQAQETTVTPAPAPQPILPNIDFISMYSQERQKVG